jgi:hypothetical protein
MRLFIPIAAGVLAIAVTATAQDTTVKSRTTIDVDEGHAVTLSGCLRQDAVTGRYTLQGTMAAAGEKVTTDTKVKTDVDDDETKTTARTRNKVNDEAVGTSGTMGIYPVVALDKMNLSSHVGRRVQLSAVMVAPGHKDAEVKVRNRTTVDPDDARDTTTRTNTKAEVDKAVAGQYTVVAVTPLGGACASR